MKQRAKQYRIDNAEKVRDQQKVRYEKNKEHINQTRKEWRERNKDAVNEKRIQGTKQR